MISVIEADAPMVKSNGIAKIAKIKYAIDNILFLCVILKTAPKIWSKILKNATKKPMIQQTNASPYPWP